MGGPALRRQATVAAVFFTLTTGLGASAAILSEGGPLFLLMLLAHNIGHAWWMSMDCARRGGRDVDGWRAFAFWFAPFTMIAYLIAEYGSRAAVFIPLYVGLETTALLSFPLTHALLHPRWGW